MNRREYEEISKLLTPQKPKAVLDFSMDKGYNEAIPNMVEKIEGMKRL